MFGNLKKFDVHVKSIDGVNQKTYLGAFLTSISVIVVSFLLVSEISYYLNRSVESKLVTDFRRTNESTVIEFDVQFDLMKCGNIGFTQEVTKGTMHVNRPEQYEETPVNAGSGCRIVGSIATDKVAGNFRLSVERGSDGSSSSDENISHKINYLYFHPTSAKFDSSTASTNTLAGRMNTAIPGAAIHQYVIQIVPTQYIALDGMASYMNEYSVSERHVDEDQCPMVENIGGHSCRDFSGVMFSYDFAPVSLYPNVSCVFILMLVTNLRLYLFNKKNEETYGISSLIYVVSLVV
jgi:hypothetical protein